MATRLPSGEIPPELGLRRVALLGWGLPTGPQLARHSADRSQGRDQQVLRGESVWVSVQACVRTWGLGLVGRPARGYARVQAVGTEVATAWGVCIA